jgi:hypothetical protein
LVGTGVAVALTSTDFLTEQERVDRQAWQPPQLERVGPRVEVERGIDWSFMAWKSPKDGACVGYAAGDATNWSRGCGPAPDRADRDPHTPDYLITLGYVPTASDGAADSRGAIYGAVTPEVSRVEIELADGRVLTARAVDVGTLGADARFFLVRDRLPPAEGIPVVAITSYGADGTQLERFDIGA